MFSISSFRSPFAWIFVPIFLVGCALLKYEKYIFQGGDYAEVLLETDAPNWIVNAFISTSGVNCDGFKHAGTLFYDKILRDGGFFGTMQKYNPLRYEENTSVLHRVPAHSTVQIQTVASYYSEGGSGLCGPVTVKFRTDIAGKFKVHSALRDGRCSLSVTDDLGNMPKVESLLCK